MRFVSITNFLNYVNKKFLVRSDASKQDNKMDKTNVAKNEQSKKDLPNSIAGFTVEHLEGKQVNVILNRNQVTSFDVSLNKLNDQLSKYNAELVLQSDYINDCLKSTMKEKSYIFKSYTTKDGSKTSASLTKSQLKVKNEINKFVETLDDSVKLNGKFYLPNKDGNYKEVSLTFTTRANMQQGLSAKQNQIRIDKLINDTIKAVKTDEVKTETETDDEVKTETETKTETTKEDSNESFNL